MRDVLERVSKKKNAAANLSAFDSGLELGREAGAGK
jgi:hypothetical protein